VTLTALNQRARCQHPDAGCANRRSVELITVAGAGHQWPCGVASPVAQRIDNLPAPSTALNATDTIWQFFTQNRR
jgi:polyhydroxybutyrate depolymerase